jgi:hypothetical protein
LSKAATKAEFSDRLFLFDKQENPIKTPNSKHDSSSVLDRIRRLMIELLTLRSQAWSRPFGFGGFQQENLIRKGRPHRLKRY